MQRGNHTSSMALPSPLRQQSGHGGPNRTHSPTASTTSNSSLNMAQQQMQLPSQSSGTATEFDSNDFPALSGDSQRGLSLPPPGALSYASLGGQPSGPQSAVGATLPSSRELSADDFPALGGPAAPALHHQPSINGLPSAPQRPLQLQQEQAAAAALAHKQGLLGSLSSGQQPSPTLRTYGLEDQRRLQTHPPNGLQQHSLRSPSSTLGPRSHLPAAKSNAPYPGSVTPSNATTTNHTGLPLTNGSAAAVTPHPDNSLLDPHANSTAMPQTPAQQVLFSPADRFGLVGLLHLIKTGDPDLTMLSLGSDLSKLGLDMGRKDSLSSTLVTPWADAESLAAIQLQPEFHLPTCYTVNPPSASTKLGQVTDETLFYIFYSQPRDEIQANAATELYKRNWRYHKEHKMWLTKVPGVEPTQKTNTFEKGTYAFFSPTRWERSKTEFTLVYEHLEKAPAGQPAA